MCVVGFPPRKLAAQIQRQRICTGASHEQLHTFQRQPIHECMKQMHIQQWKHNRDFLCTINAKYSDWIVTVSFYVAVHAVDALLCFDGSFVDNHKTRNDILLRTNRYLAIKTPYLNLYNLSRTIRYLANPTLWVPPEQIETQVIGRYLYPVEKSVQNLMSINLHLPKIMLASPKPNHEAKENPAP